MRRWHLEHYNTTFIGFFFVMRDETNIPSPLGVFPQTTSSCFFPLSSGVLDEASSDFEPDALRRRSSPCDMEKEGDFEEKR